MSSHEPILISDSNLSRAWSQLLLYAIDHSGNEVSPLVLSISGLEALDVIPEIPTVREALDTLLRSKSEFEVSTVANTIFPQSVWRISRGNRQEFFEEYREALPRYAAMEPLNKNGTYFSRLIAFDLNPQTGERLPHIPYGSVPENGNQLEHIIRLFGEGRIRRDSAFQAAIFDPVRDHSLSAYQSFPCMQHLTFVKSVDGCLALNAFYATQQIVRKAYGNFLGLCRLGHFVSSQANLRLDRLNVFVGSEKIGGFAKAARELRPVIAAARSALRTATLPQHAVAAVSAE